MDSNTKTEPKEESACSDDEEEEEDVATNGYQGSNIKASENGSWPAKQETKTDTSSYSPQDDAQIADDGPGSQFIERYKCHHCEKSYKNMRSLNQHFREVQVCRVCKMSLPNVEEFTSHILEDHTVGALCGVCMSSFRSRARLVEHVHTHTQLTVKKTDVNRNRKLAAAAIKSSCKICHAELSPLSPHNCHANVCKVCRKPLRTRSEFEMHMMRLHCSDDLCQFCGSKLPTLQKLISHLKSHTSLRFPAHKCLKCGVRFRNEMRLKEHDCQPQVVTKKISDSPSPKKGTDQNKGSPQEKFSLFEKNSHNMRSPFQNGEITEGYTENLKHHCEWCNEQFKYVRDLKQHKLERHTCKFCKKTLTTQIEFEKHLMEEHSSKDECQFCLRKFVCTTALRTHLKTHTAIIHKIHKCKKCKEKFASLKDKTRHTCVRIRCGFCNQPFNCESALQSHIVKDHPETSLLQCNNCSKYFPTRQILKRHILMNHK